MAVSTVFHGPDKTPPTRADEWLLLALIANVQGRAKDTMAYEEAALQCDDYSPERFVAYLVATAQRHTQYENVTQLYGTLERANRYARCSLRGRLTYMIGTGVALSWHGELIQGLAYLKAAQMLLGTLANPSYLNLWVEAAGYTVFVLEQIARTPEQHAQLAQFLQN